MLRWIFIFILVLACHSVVGAASYPAVKITESYRAERNWKKPTVELYCDHYCLPVATILKVNVDGKEEWVWSVNEAIINNLKYKEAVWTITFDETKQITSMFHESYYEEKRLDKLIRETISYPDAVILKELERD